ncbi:hypothetical protein [Peribacillus frigoritolerans]|uniref:hypothetical protein n=1 Tax=Peribacillus frigoritolerans TaxID=450367 RepID=UPI003306076E
MISEKEMIFENEQYVTIMVINKKGEGHDRGVPRLDVLFQLPFKLKKLEMN